LLNSRQYGYPKVSGYMKLVFRLPYLFIYFVVFLSSFDIYCQSKVLQFRHLSDESGLSSPKVNCALQDYKGFMWVGTNDGLNKYDGNNFTTYKTYPHGKGKIFGNYIVTLFQDHNNHLFIGTDAGLSLYDRDLDHFVNYSCEKSSALFSVKTTVNKICEDSIGNLWLATETGLIYFDRIHNKIDTYMHNPPDTASISNNDVLFVYIDLTGRIWAGTRKGLNIFSPETRGFQHISRCSQNKENISELSFLDIAEDKERKLWFGTSNGLFYLNNNEGSNNLQLSNFEYRPDDPDGIAKERVEVLYIANNGDLWIHSLNKGISLYNKSGNNFSHYRMDEFNPMGLTNEAVTEITQDRNDNLWVCTYNDGINISVKNSGFIVGYKSLPGAVQSLSVNIVSCFLEDRMGHIWVGTDGGGLNLFNNKTNRFKRYNNKNSNLKSVAILCIAEGDENEIWLGTWAGGLVRFNTKTNNFKAYTVENSGIPDNSIYSIAKDKSGNMWMGSFSKGLIYYKIKENKFFAYTTENSEILNDQINVVKIDNKGKVYLGSVKSFQAFVPGEDKFITYTKSLKDPKSISTDCVYDILIENDTSVWLATANGLDLLNPLKGIFTKYFTEDGLPHNSLKGLIFDKSGVLWLTTNNGICQFDYHKKTFRNFYVSDGLESNVFYERSIYVTKNGSILAGGSKGFNLITPEDLPGNKIPPQVVLTGFDIFNQEAKIGEKGSPLVKQISETKEITLSYKQSVLTFYFSALDYTNPQKNQYAYTMENFDKAWNYCGNRRDATYTNLSPGKYIFRVKASNSDGVWNENGTSLQITITPPWWKTTLAIVVFGLIIFCLFFSFYFFRVNQLHKQKERLENLVKIRTHEIEEKNIMLHKQTLELSKINELLGERQQQIEEQAEKLQVSNEMLHNLNATKDKFFSIIAHDLRSPFNSIMGFCELLFKRYEKMDDAKRKKLLGTVYESSKNLLKLLENLLQWARSQTGNISFDPEEFDINELINTNISLVNNLLQEKGVKLKKRFDGKISVYADKNMISTVIRNLITNAVKFTETGGITIETFQDKDNATVKIIDTGLGISKDKLGKIFDIENSKSTSGTRGESGTGLGLIICKEFVEKNGGSISVSSEPGKGSVFCFSIPNKSS
jgi:ligand-binding sensor domain-containing protein/signal transduction histidine kinase